MARFAFRLIILGRCGKGEKMKEVMRNTQIFSLALNLDFYNLGEQVGAGIQTKTAKRKVSKTI